MSRSGSIIEEVLFIVSLFVEETHIDNLVSVIP